MRGQYPTRLGRLLNMTATEEQACHKIAQKLSEIVGDYVDPYEMRLYPAKGFWAHLHQDVQRFTGFVSRNGNPKLKNTIGSWDLTISDIANGRKFTVADQRGDKLSDADFVVVKP